VEQGGSSARAARILEESNYSQTYAEQSQTVKHAHYPNQEQAGIGKNGEPSHEHDYCTHKGNDDEEEDKPREEVDPVFKSHNFHAFSGLGLFLLCQLRNQIEEGDQICKHEHSREVYLNVLNSALVHIFIRIRLHWSVSHAYTRAVGNTIGVHDYSGDDWVESEEPAVFVSLVGIEIRS
jgi:hypothetical protein